MNNKAFYSHGKLLLSGEYVVLDGALSLAIPTKFGQSLSITPIDDQILHWKSFDYIKQVWFENKFNIINFEALKREQNDAISNRLSQILKVVNSLNPEFINNNSGLKIETHLEFPKNWGLGTSSTLINNIANWANIDAYTLLEDTFGGSGYDIACAQNNSAITYQLKNKKPIIKKTDFNPVFKEHLYFVHLNKKQNSRDGIKYYRQNKANDQSALKDINTITLEMINSTTLEHFKSLMIEHETIISKLTKQTPVKRLLFKDFSGAIKSLGAWGGDFIMVASNQNPTNYFKKKGYETIIPYSEMIL
ncbi:GYDIA family GHMP kinase [uncultured Algibacter sp.]|uniref:GYDIA family GHMP kinase n=1 Tax=uncultured Algibacter sp. TaxID=298659 RepID=UPI002626F65B|nr:GYDIA family GHMP kinase [uncultured Algibacter sp.]